METHKFCKTSDWIWAWSLNYLVWIQIFICSSAVFVVYILRIKDLSIYPIDDNYTEELHGGIWIDIKKFNDLAQIH